MDEDDVTLIELLTVPEEHADEAKEMLVRWMRFVRQIPGVHRAWAIQDRERPGEFAAVGLVDPARVAEIEREAAEAELHQAMQPRWREILVPGRFRRVIGAAAE